MHKRCKSGFQKHFGLTIKILSQKLEEKTIRDTFLRRR
jgi:hypothetical protein